MKILLVVYDNDGYIHWFPQGLGYIAAILKKNGDTVDIYNQDYHHYPDAHLTEFLNTNHYDFVCVSVIGGYYQYRKLLSLSDAINKSKNRPIYVIGGHGPSPEPEYFLKKTKADAVVIGEGEKTVIELFDSLINKKSLRKVKGIAYLDEDKCIITEPRELIDNIDAIPHPAYELFPMEYYRLLRMPHCNSRDFILPLLSGRGCPFKCNFCYRMDKGFRARSNESIIDEIKFLKKEYRITYVAFSDELLMSSAKRTISLCEDMIRANLNIKWDCNGRLNYATPEVLKVMKRAGCVFINYGIECYDDQILKNMNKVLTTEQIDQGIRATKNENISPGFNIIFGNIGENQRTLQQGVDFLLKYDDGAQFRTIRPVTGYPGTELYKIAIKKGLLKDVEDFYENKHTNSDLLAINFTQITDDEFYEALTAANKTLAQNYFEKKSIDCLNQIENVYKNRDASFRGFRHT